MSYRQPAITGLRLWLCLAILSQAALASNPPNSERGALVRVITKWNEPDGAWHCDGSERTSWDDMIRAWYKDLTNTASTPDGHGSNAWVRDGFYQNGYIVDSDFVDTSKQAWGRDNWSDRADEPDVLMIGLHGGNGTDGRWSGAVRVNQFGDDGSLNNCSSWQGHMEFGDADLEFLHLSSCYSMDQEDWYPNWASSFKGVHQIDGFHGLMWISSSYANRYKNFADDGFDMGLAFAWLENLYKYRKSGENMCPVARGVGVGANGKSNAWNRLNHERYNNVYSEPNNPTFHGLIHVLGCDPKGGDPLPSSASLPPSGTLATSMATEESPTGLPPLDRTVMTLRDYEAMVDTSLPTFDATILAAPDGPDWMSAISPSRVAVAVGDTTPDLLFENGPRTEARDTADTTVIKIDRVSGRVRYINRSRHFNWDTDPHTAWDPADAQNKVMNALSLLGVPSTELDATGGCCRVDTVVGKDYDAASTSSIPTSTHEAERWVTVARTVNGLPVDESFVRGVVSNTGLIGRIQVLWPRFQLPTGLVLRTRQSVVSEIGARIQQSEFGAAVNLSIELAYARVGDQHLPVAHVSFDDPYSGEEIWIPLVEQGPDADLDSVPDAADNCIDVANPDQSDIDSDGVGDACDNCTDIFNPGQEDGDPAGAGDPTGENPADGVGDACEVEQNACRLPDGTCETLSAGDCSAEAGSDYGTELVSSLWFSDLDSLSWSSVPTTTTFALYRGNLGGGAFSYDHTCRETGISGTSTIDIDQPGSSLGYYYLLSVQDECGESRLGSDSTGQPIPNPAACP